RAPGTSRDRPRHRDRPLARRRDRPAPDARAAPARRAPGPRRTGRAGQVAAVVVVRADGLRDRMEAGALSAEPAHAPAHPPGTHPLPGLAADPRTPPDAGVDRPSGEHALRAPGLRPAARGRTLL